MATFFVLLRFIALSQLIPEKIRANMNNQFVSKESLNSCVYYKIEHPKFAATISEFGGQLLSFTPKDNQSEPQDLLWLSESSPLDGSKPIRGGVPLCWPWFGPAQGDFVGEPQHGYIRSVPWSLINVAESDTSVEMIMQPNLTKELSQSLGLDVQVRYVFADTVSIELTTTNTSTEAKPLSQAIHTYFALDNVNDHKVLGLNQIRYLDNLDNAAEVIQDGDVVITEHTDRVYLTAQDKVTLLNGNKNMDILGQGHDSIVVWNPWQENAKNMVDFDDQGYSNMICIEMANTQGLVLQPQQVHKLVQLIKP
jgi:glucose-6-phosphate 1-epimerase